MGETGLNSTNESKNHIVHLRNCYIGKAKFVLLGLNLMRGICPKSKIMGTNQLLHMKNVAIEASCALGAFIQVECTNRCLAQRASVLVGMP